VNKTIKAIIGVVVGVVVLVSVGTFVYIHFIEGDSPAPLTFDTSSTTAAGSTNTTASGTTSAVAGTWKPTSASQVGYRVKEVLFGQNTEAVGRTNHITGSMTASATQVQSVDLTVDMTTVKSDQANRDNQFRNRIMDTSTYPTATFKLTKPIAIPSGLSTTPVTVKATGDLTLHGVKKSVTTDLKVRRNGANVEVNGSIPITFADYKVDNPSFGPAQTEDNGQLELLVVFSQ
jgi:polyisoprenoid-binding protein YceI